MTSVEQLVAETQSGNTRAHSIVINTDAKLNTLTTIDLSGDTNTTSSGVINLNGVTAHRPDAQRRQRHEQHQHHHRR